MLTVFKSNRDKFDQFTRWAQADNPSLEVNNWTISGEDLLWRWRHRK